MPFLIFCKFIFLGNLNMNDELGYEKQPRAGLIPYTYREDGTMIFLTMIASDPKFGGPRPMISKGKIESNEDSLGAAVREAEEELGLKRENIVGPILEVAKERVTLYSGTYLLDVYGCRILDRYDFDKWCEETEYIQWFSLEEFAEHGRRDHYKYLQMLQEQVLNNKD